MNKQSRFGLIFNIANILIILASLWFLLNALFMRGFGGVFPLWARFLGIFILFWILMQRRIKQTLLKLAENKMPKNEILSYVAKVISIVVVLSIAVIFWHQSANQRYLQNIFKEFFKGTDVKKVTLIEGSFFKWMDWSGRLTFKADDKTFEKIAKDYEIISKDKITGNFFVEHIMENPTIIFYNKKVKLDDKMYDDCYLAREQKGQIVYFHVSNAFYQK